MPEPAPEGSGHRGSTGPRRLALALGVAVVVVAVDQVTKVLALDHVTGPTHVIGPFGLALGYNSGAAFSLFTGAVGVLVGVAVIVIAVLVFLAWRAQGPAMVVALGLVLGGALGNLGDRAFRGHHGQVVDFVTLEHWPTFNVADACITVGVVLAVALSLVRAARDDR